MSENEELDEFKRRIREIILSASDDDNWYFANHEDQLLARERVIDEIEALVTDEPPVDPSTFVEVSLWVSDTEDKTFNQILDELTEGTSQYLSAQVVYAGGIVPPITRVKVKYTGPVEDIQEITARYVKHAETHRG